MNINISKVPTSIFYFITGVAINVLLYSVLSPNEGNLIGILSDTTEGAVGTTPTQMVWLIIFIFCILANMALPIWVLFDSNEDEQEGE